MSSAGRVASRPAVRSQAVSTLVTVIFTESRCLGSMSSTPRTRASNNGSPHHAAAVAQDAAVLIWAGWRPGQWVGWPTFSAASNAQRMPWAVATGLAAYSRQVSGANANWSHGPGSAAVRNVLPDNATAEVLNSVSATPWASASEVIHSVGSNRYGVKSLG